MKNQWGWGGFTTQDLARCRPMARLVALVYNWWILFVWVPGPTRHLEAITSRPLLLTSIAERLRHARQTTLRIASTHRCIAYARRVRKVLTHALRHFLQGRELRPSPRLPAPAVWCTRQSCRSECGISRLQ